MAFKNPPTIRIKRQSPHSCDKEQNWDINICAFFVLEQYIRIDDPVIKLMLKLTANRQLHDRN